MKFLTAALAAALLLQCATAPASAAKRGEVFNGTRLTLMLTLHGPGVLERVELAPYRSHYLPEKVEGAIGTVSELGKSCAAQTKLNASSDVTFVYFANAHHCSFEHHN